MEQDLKAFCFTRNRKGWIELGGLATMVGLADFLLGTLATSPSLTRRFPDSVGHVFGNSSAQLLPLCSFVLHFANIRGPDGGEAPSWGIRGMFEIHPVLRMPVYSRGVDASKTLLHKGWDVAHCGAF